MPQFAYKAKKDDGSVVTGTLQAESERSALDSLGRMGVFPLQIESREEDKVTARAAAAPRQVARRIKSSEVSLFTRQLADLLRAGVPLNRALEIDERVLGSQHPQIVNDLRSIALLDLKTGNLADAEARLERALGR